MNYIFYQTKTKYSNTGDMLINRALIEALRKFGVLYANCSKNIPGSFLASLGLTSDEKMVSKNELDFIKAVLKYALKCRKNGDRVYVFSGPGELFGSKAKLVIRNFASGLILPVLRLAGVKIVRIGRSVGPISRLMAISEWIRCVSLSHYFVRDCQSLARCKKMGIKKVKFCPDMAWMYDVAHSHDINRTNVVMVNLRNSIFDEVDEEFVETTLQKCEEVLDRINLFTRGKMKVFVTCQTTEDEGFSRVVYERLKKRYETEHSNHKMLLEDLKPAYQKVDYHISNRMHSLLVGYKYGSLPIALVDTRKHVKISSTFTDNQLEDLMFDISDPLDLQRLLWVLTNRNQIMHTLFDCERKNQEKVFSALRDCFQQRIEEA